MQMTLWDVRCSCPWEWRIIYRFVKCSVSRVSASAQLVPYHNQSGLEMENKRWSPLPYYQIPKSESKDTFLQMGKTKLLKKWDENVPVELDKAERQNKMHAEGDPFPSSLLPPKVPKFSDSALLSLSRSRELRALKTKITIREEKDNEPCQRIPQSYSRVMAMAMEEAEKDNGWRRRIAGAESQSQKYISFWMTLWVIIVIRPLRPPLQRPQSQVIFKLCIEKKLWSLLSVLGILTKFSLMVREGRFDRVKFYKLY